jgi:hypothetical protein
MAQIAHFDRKGTRRSRRNLRFSVFFNNRHLA